MVEPIVLGIDLVLGALIGPPGCAAESVIARAETGEWKPVVIDLALYCALASVRDGDRVDHARFAQLLRHASIVASRSREPGASFAPPAPSEIEHWRAVVLEA